MRCHELDEAERAEEVGLEHVPCLGRAGEGLVVGYDNERWSASGASVKTGGLWLVPEVLDGACHTDASIVDEDIDMPIYFQGRLKLLVQIGRSHVQRHPSASNRFDLRYNLGCLVGIARRRYHFVTSC